MKKNTISFLKTFMFFLLSIFLLSCGSDDNEPITDSPNEPSFEVTGFTPVKGIEGTEIIINGNNFGNNAQDVEITLNNLSATITEISDTQIKVTAPKNNRGIEASLKISVNSVTNTLDQKFLYPDPIINDFSPKTSILFKDIVIQGNYFSNNPSDIKVTMNNRIMTIVSSTLNSIVFQTRDRDLLLQQFPISVEIDGGTVTSTENFTYGAQFKVNDDKVNTNYKNNIPICPGSAINFDINDNRSAGNLQGSTSTETDPIFLFNTIEAPILSNVAGDNGGRDWFVDVPTSIAIGAATIAVQIDGINLLVEESDQIEIGEGTFKLESNTISKFSAINIELSHIFRKPREMIVRFKNMTDNSMITGSILNNSFSDDVTKTNLVVKALDLPGTYTVSVFTSDESYELKPLNSSQLVLTD